MRPLWMLLGCTLSTSMLTAAEPESADVIVYGGTSGGVVAAVQAARMGKSVILIEPGRHLGGLTSGGLGMTDSGNKEVIGGVSREFYQRIKKYYSRENVWKYQTHAEYKYDHPADDTLMRFEPHVAEEVFREMLREAGAKVVLGQRLDLRNGVKKEGARITEIVMESGKVYRGRIFLDTSYEGDLMAKAGVTYTVGRESAAQYGETLNGIQTAHAKSHQFTRPVDPYVKPGDPKSGLLPGVSAEKPGEDGQGDKRVQAYNFRMCLTDLPENRVPYPKPEGYDPLRYELLARYLTPEWNDLFGNHQAMPNRKTDTNNHGGFGTDNIGMNYEYPDGDYATRERIIQEHRTYQQGMLWFLAHDPRVPETVRARVNKWGLAKDEFIDNGNWPHQLYIREARRMVSEYVHGEADCRRSRATPEPVGMGSYNMDSHNCQRYVDAKGLARNEGDIQVHPGAPYLISYQSLRPRAEECVNLLVPICLSCSHIAYGSVRMEPVFMVLGQSAATAACLALDEKVSVQQVPYEKLKERLLADKQVLEWKGAGHAVSGAPAKLDGLVVGSKQAKLTGEWAEGSFAGVLGVYQHDQNKGKGEKRARFEAQLTEDGEYDVRLAYVPNPNRATNVPVTIEFAGGAKTVMVNQRQKPPLEHGLLSLGVFRFAANQPAAVTVSNEKTDGFVIIDAVQWLPAPKRP